MEKIIYYNTICYHRCGVVKITNEGIQVLQEYVTKVVLGTSEDWNKENIFEMNLGDWMGNGQGDIREVVVWRNVPSRRRSGKQTKWPGEGGFVATENGSQATHWVIEPWALGPGHGSMPSRLPVTTSPAVRGIWNLAQVIRRRKWHLPLLSLSLRRAPRSSETILAVLSLFTIEIVILLNDTFPWTVSPLTVNVSRGYFTYEKATYKS